MGKLTKLLKSVKKPKVKDSMDAPDIERRLGDRKRRKDEAEAKVTPKTGTHTKGIVTATAIREAKTANELYKLERELADKPDSLSNKALGNMLRERIRIFEEGQAADVDRASRNSAQANRDRQPFKGYTPTSPFAKGGYANCGASMKPDGKRRK